MMFQNVCSILSIIISIAAIVLSSRNYLYVKKQVAAIRAGTTNEAGTT